MKKSSVAYPIKFFEETLKSEDNIRKIAKQLLVYSDYNSYEFNEHYTEIKCFGLNENRQGTYEVIEHTSNLIIHYLKREYENSKSYIYQYCITNNNNEFSVRNYLTIQVKAIQLLINGSEEILTYHPYFLIPLRSLVKYINEMLLLPNMEKFEINEKSTDFIVVDNDNNYNIEVSDLNKIHSVLSYMKGKNEKQQIILNEEDYNLLIEYTTHLIEKEEVPEVSKQLEPKLSNDLIRFSFWVLHKEIYTTKEIRKYFYDFIKIVFEKFKGNEISSIKSQFGTKSRVPKDNFLPEIITKHLS
ncbi:MAG: hypothetical protein ACK5NB_13555 [Flavobacteriaceae bacterium]